MSSEIEIKLSKSFKQDFKPLYKKYPSLKRELYDLQKMLFKNPFLGTSLGSNIFKIRIAIKSKGKGKSGGGRVITFVEKEIILSVEKTTLNHITVNLVTIYDKSEMPNITIEELKQLIANMKFD